MTQQGGRADPDHPFVATRGQKEQFGAVFDYCPNDTAGSLRRIPVHFRHPRRYPHRRARVRVRGHGTRPPELFGQHGLSPAPARVRRTGGLFEQCELLTMLLAAPLLRRLYGLLPHVAEQGSKHDNAAAAAAPEWDRPRVSASLADEEAEHRLANLFQLVVSDLNQAARLSDGAARLAIDSAAGQVTDLGRLYQMLGGSCRYREGCGDHLRALGKALDALVLSPRGHSFTVEVAGEAATVLLPTAAVRCLSQVVVELVINAAKHAFPNGPGGCVVLKLAVSGEYVSCSIIDDGVGCGPASSRSDSRGMRLINQLVKHGGGRCRWVFSNTGTDVRVLLPLDQSCAREILLDAQSIKARAPSA